MTAAAPSGAAPQQGPGLPGLLDAVVLARWVFVVASVLETVVGPVQLQALGAGLAILLTLGNLALLRGARAAETSRSLRRLAVCSVLLDFTVVVSWIAVETASPIRGQMFIALGLVGVEAAALFGRTVTLAVLVAIMAILGGAEVIRYQAFARPADLPVAIIRVALLWSIVLLARVLLGGFTSRGGLASPGSQAGAVVALKEGALQEVLDGAPGAMIAADEGGRVVLVNAAALRVFDRTRREILDAPASALVPGIYEDLPHGAGARYLTREVITAAGDRPWAGVRRDGSTFPAEISYSTLQSGQRVLVAASVRDITDRVKAEQERDLYKAQLDEAQRLESLGRLAGGIAHDFNNMLNVILNYTDFADQATTDPAVKADLGEVRAAGHRAARLTQQLLRLAGRETLRPEPMNLAGAVAEIEGRLRGTLGQGTTLVVRVSPELAPVLGDPTMVDEVLAILVENAAQAMPVGGEIVVEANEVTVTREFAAAQPDLAPGAYVVLRVSDPGQGMDDETRSRALEPFFTTRTASGAGLGLPTAFGLVRQSGGTLLIDSALGRGTTVEVYLRAAAGPGQAEEAEAAFQASPRDGRPTPGHDLDTIMILDHDDAHRANIVGILERNNLHVVEARDGADALRVAADAPGIKVVLMERVAGTILDLGLPDLLRTAIPGARMVLVSALSRRELQVHGLDDPRLPYLDRDCSDVELITTVHQLLAQPAPV